MPSSGLVGSAPLPDVDTASAVQSQRLICELPPNLATTVTRAAIGTSYASSRGLMRSDGRRDPWETFEEMERIIDTLGAQSGMVRVPEPFDV